MAMTMTIDVRIKLEAQLDRALEQDCEPCDMTAGLDDDGCDIEPCDMTDGIDDDVDMTPEALYGGPDQAVILPPSRSKYNKPLAVKLVVTTEAAALQDHYWVIQTPGVDPRRDTGRDSVRSALRRIGCIYNPRRCFWFAWSFQSLAPYVV